MDYTLGLCSIIYVIGITVCTMALPFIDSTEIKVQYLSILALFNYMGLVITIIVTRFNKAEPLGDKDGK